MGIKNWMLVFCFLLFVVFNNCSKNENEFTLGENFIESETGIIMIDTFQMQMSTIIMDSMPTNGTGVAVCGVLDDDYLGRVICQTYFQFGIPLVDPDLSTEDVFDSIVLILPYTGAYYGDTNLTQTYSVHILEEDMVPVNSSYFFNTSSLSYNSALIANKSFIPYPNYYDSLVITLDAAFGRDLFELIQEGSEVVDDDETFLDYLKGLVLIPDTNTSAAVLSFDAYSETFCMRVFYHKDVDVDEDEIEVEYFDFQVLYDMQFNSIKGNRANTVLNDLYDQRYAVPSSQADDLTFIQGGTGIMTCLRFPSLNSFQLMENRQIFKAMIVLIPQESSYYSVTLPSEIVLVSTNKYNHYIDVYTDYYGNEITANFSLDNQYNENTYFTFDITGYVQAEFEDNYFDINNGLLVSLPSNDILSKIERIVFTADPHKSKLMIYSIYY